MNATATEPLKEFLREYKADLLISNYHARRLRTATLILISKHLFPNDPRPIRLVESDYDEFVLKPETYQILYRSHPDNDSDPRVRRPDIVKRRRGSYLRSSTAGVCLCSICFVDCPTHYY